MCITSDPLRGEICQEGEERGGVEGLVGLWEGMAECTVQRLSKAAGVVLVSVCSRRKWKMLGEI